MLSTVNSLCALTDITLTQLSYCLYWTCTYSGIQNFSVKCSTLHISWYIFWQQPTIFMLEGEGGEGGGNELAGNSQPFWHDVLHWCGLHIPVPSG